MVNFKRQRNKIIVIDEIGYVTLKKHRSAKKLTLTGRAFQGFSATIPERASFKWAEKEVLSKKKWLQKTKSSILKKEKNFIQFFESRKLHVTEKPLQLKSWNRSSVNVKVTKETILIQYPRDESFNPSDLHLYIYKGIMKTLRLEAKEYLPQTTLRLSKHFQLSYQNLRLKNLVSRWGSCSSANNINLNIKLMLLPVHLREYVILHELAHLREKNHGIRFWKLVDAMTNHQGKKLDYELRKAEKRLF